jgi:hypothetical protein
MPFFQKMPSFPVSWSSVPVIFVIALFSSPFQKVCYSGFVEDELHTVYTEGCTGLLSDSWILSCRDTTGLDSGDRSSYCTISDSDFTKRFGPVSKALPEIWDEGAGTEKSRSYAAMCMTLGRVSRLMDANDVRKLFYLLGEIGKGGDSGIDNTKDLVIYLAFTLGRISGGKLSLELLLGWSIESNKDRKRTERYREFLRGLLIEDESLSLRTVRSVPIEAVESVMARCRAEAATLN